MKKNETKSFVVFDNNKKGLLFDDSKNENFPIRYYNVINGEGLKREDNCSYYIYAYNGDTSITTKREGTIILYEGMYASCSSEFSLSNNGKAIVIEVLQEQSDYYLSNKYKAMFHVGGVLEEEGRLKYIDGCTDSLLIPPVKYGDPCLNHLHFPKNITQTQHTHPSHRIGIVSNGSGLCITPFGNLALEKEMIFIIKSWDGVSMSKGLDGKLYPDGQHSFETFDENMDVVAFHPDSDFGAKDEFHPMINRTIVNGISANSIDEIKTK